MLFVFALSPDTRPLTAGHTGFLPAKTARMPARPADTPGPWDVFSSASVFALSRSLLYRLNPTSHPVPKLSVGFQPLENGLDRPPHRTASRGGHFGRSRVRYRTTSPQSKQSRHLFVASVAILCCSGGDTATRILFVHSYF